jgi:hypothetical protein
LTGAPAAALPAGTGVCRRDRAVVVVQLAVAVVLGAANLPDAGQPQARHHRVGGVRFDDPADASGDGRGGLGEDRLGAGPGAPARLELGCTCERAGSCG